MDNDNKTTDSKVNNNATWSCDDQLTLVRALKKAKRDGKWGDNNPKEAAWTFCVGELSGSEKLSGGVAKDAKAVRRRWQRVRALHIFCDICALSSISSVETGIRPIQKYARTIWMGVGQ